MYTSTTIKQVSLLSKASVPRGTLGKVTSLLWASEFRERTIRTFFWVRAMALWRSGRLVALWPAGNFREGKVGQAIAGRGGRPTRARAQGRVDSGFENFIATLSSNWNEVRPCLEDGG